MRLDLVGRWITRIVSIGGLAVVGWVVVTAWPAVRHGHPAYAVLLAVTVLAFGAGAAASWRQSEPQVAWWRSLLRTMALLVAGGWLGVVGFLRPFPAQQPAVSAMTSDAAVAVRESATEITLQPRGAADRTGVFFFPGARVDSRAYAAVLRPLAEAGHPVVIAKPPVGLAFVAGDAFERARSSRPEVSGWVVGGHSLGGVAAAADADAHDADTPGRVIGLVLYAAYPASDLSRTLSCRALSVSGSADGLTTPDLIAQTRSRLPQSAEHVVVEGGVHAFFGDYGSQPGDGTPSVPRDQARARISAVTLAFVAGLA